MDKTKTDHVNMLVWMGLEVPLREDWRPLKIEGNHTDGSIIVGDRMGPVFQMRWLRPGKNFDPAVWLEARQRTATAGQSSPGCPAPQGFDTVGWVRNFAVKEDASKTIWWGYSEKAGVQVEIILTDLCTPGNIKWFIKKSLPSLNALQVNAPWNWRIFSAGFSIPEGYILKEHRLAVGDIALLFQKSKHERLVVRQVYPAGLALRRRTLKGWLNDKPFKQRRRFYGGESSLAPDIARLYGDSLRYEGRKNIPFPLGWFAPRNCTSIVVEDKKLDRLLIVEAQTPESDLTLLAEETLAGMNKDIIDA